MAETPNTDIHYNLAPDALSQEGVPKGEIKGPLTLPSEAYPGTQHTYWVYVPAQYDPATPASLMIFQDGQAWVRPTGDYRTTFVLDNLIYRREIPVMIAVFMPAILPCRLRRSYSANRDENSMTFWRSRSLRD